MWYNTNPLVSDSVLAWFAGNDLYYYDIKLGDAINILES